jgi:ABC-type Fe3+/spermidine/putrescine transport system ATPase subunit
MPGKPHIEVDGLEMRYGDVHAVRGVSFTVAPGEQLTLLGPSGCGKTTTLRAVAGLEQPTAGEIRIDGVPVFSSGRTGAAELAEKVHRALDMVQMRAFADRRASQLSGGQQQRVALARAFVFQPSVLLFDEPLSNLDAKLRADMRIELRDLQHRLGITSLYVTHDLEEALAMSDRIVVMRDGLVEQTGTPDEIYSRPRSAFVADFIGSANLIRGRARPDLAAGDLIALESADGQIIYGMAYGRPVAGELIFSVRTVHLQLSLQRPGGTKNVWPVRVEKTVFQGDFSQVHIHWGAQRLVARCAAMDPIAAGREVFLTVEPRRVVLLGE